MNLYQYVILIGSVISIAIADVFLKKASMTIVAFSDLFKSPWFIAAIILYGIQIIAFCYLFFLGNKLSVVGFTQIVLYTLVIVISGLLFFQESLSLIQILGAVLAIIGIILLNIVRVV